MAGAIALFVTGAIFGDVAVSLVVAGAASGEFWVESQSAKCCNIPYKMRLQNFEK